MSNPYSIAHYGINDERKSITLALQNGQWSSIANNTKWTELISAIRNDDWHPSYRFCWISNRFISSWDAEWHHHLPYPFAGVLWFDMSTLEHQIEKPWGHKKIIDHSTRLINLLLKIGLEHEKRGDVIRIWGYLPKDETDFPPQANFKQPHHIFSDTWK
ncbi:MULTISPECIES: DUF6678 family protein [Acinetobacter]|uniref:DUF6678 family protein n=1 Tax=Acinetobacter TaxID=469 RepID=UPI001038FDF1|nr:DUF6678 family protein [Acinetobacter sp. ANC 4641]TCB13471.1 hypothetical protein E0H78_02380 [Acinetobacter sp. ANC 4641]